MTARGWLWASALLQGFLVCGCQVETWRNADLQLEIHGAELSTETQIRMCVDGVGSRDVALGAGLTAFPGLPATGDLTVTVDALQAGDTGADALQLGRAGPVTFSANPTAAADDGSSAAPVEGPGLADATWVSCDTDCTPCRQDDQPVDQSNTRLLAVRFNP